jgi:leucine dehydrogenase
VFSIRDSKVGLNAIIAIHDTSLGPAVGGCRAVEYASHNAALADALRLSQAMTYKAALANLPLGGGKTVISVDPRMERSEELFRLLGHAINLFGGQYITGEDSGTSVREMDWISQETNHVMGTSARGGNPARMTAWGVMAGLRRAVRHRLGTDSLASITVAVQGLGNVGTALCEFLATAGAHIIVTDIDPSRIDAVVQRLDARPVDPLEFYRTAADVFAPCALGAILNDRTIPELRCAVVAGSANNQLAHNRIGNALGERGILYAPDFVINAGGLISAGLGWLGDNPNGPVVIEQVERIGETLAAIFRRSDADKITPVEVANRVAKERLQRAQIRRISFAKECA